MLWKALHNSVTPVTSDLSWLWCCLAQRRRTRKWRQGRSLALQRSTGSRRCYRCLRSEIDLAVLEVESVGQVCLSCHLPRYALSHQNQVQVARLTKEGRVVAFDEPRWYPFPVERVPLADHLRYVFDRDVWESVGSMACLEDGFPGACGLNRVACSRRLEMRGRHGLNAD